MSEYIKTVEMMECDRFGLLPPKQILEHCLSVTVADAERDGCGRAALYEACGAVWMISHMRIVQYVPVRPYEELVYRTFPRIEDGNRYIYSVEIFRGDECVIRFDTSYIPVDKAERRIIRLSRLASLWKTPARSADAPTLHSLRPTCDFSPCGSDTVRLSDCDSNGHMTSGAYLSLVCNAVGFWESETPRLMRMMQVDFSREVLPETRLCFERGEADGLRYVRGISSDGKTAFTAVCDF